MNPVLSEILTTGNVKSANGELVKLKGDNVPTEEGEFLQEIVSEVKPKTSLEVGLAYGISTLFICDALEKTSGHRHIVLDPYQMQYYNGIGLENIKRAGYEEIVDFYDQSSHVLLPQLEAQGTKIDFAFIDGLHLFDYTLLEFFYIDKMLRVGGVIAFDDATWPSVFKVGRFMVTNRSYSVFRCLKPLNRNSALKRQLLTLKHRFLSDPDIKLGLLPGSRCIAFKKEAEDTRKGQFYKNF